LAKSDVKVIKRNLKANSTNLIDTILCQVIKKKPKRSKKKVLNPKHLIQDR